jgi:hypothetical protein
MVLALNTMTTPKAMSATTMAASSVSTGPVFGADTA